MIGDGTYGEVYEGDIVGGEMLGTHIVAKRAKDFAENRRPPSSHSDSRAEACRRLHNPAAIAAPSCCFVPDTSRLLACSTADGEWRIGTSTRGPGKCTSCLQVGLPEQEDLPSDGIASIPGNFNAARICGSEPTDSGREPRMELVVVAEPCICKRLLPELITPN